MKEVVFDMTTNDLRKKMQSKSAFWLQDFDYDYYTFTAWFSNESVPVLNPYPSYRKPIPPKIWDEINERVKG